MDQHPQQQQQQHVRMPSIPLAELPLRPSSLSLLQQRGFVTTAELEDARVQQGVATLAAELDLSLGETANLLMEIQSCLRTTTTGGGGGDVVVVEADSSIDTSVAIPPTVNARDLLGGHNNNLKHGQNNNHIVTYCQDLDQLLGGGIALGQVTEIAGLPATGKTQLAMQLAVMCRLPKLFGGVEGKVLYIDAEGSFAPERCAQMATALSQHVQLRIQKATAPNQPPPIHASLTERDFLESIQVFRVHDEASQTATLYNLPQYLDSRDAVPVKLIVIDSIAFHYRAMTTSATKQTNVNAPNNGNKNNNQKNSYGQRTKSLIRLAGFLADLARSHHLAVVCINQMTTKMHYNNSSTRSTTSTTTDNNINKSVLVPALGESWAHAVTTRLLLQMPLHNNDVNNNRQWRTCQLVKSPHRPSGMVPFQITPQGIRRVPSNRNRISQTISQNSQEAASSQQTTPAATTNYQTPQQPHRPMPKQTTTSSSSSSSSRPSSLRRPLQPHNLKPPPSYSTNASTTTTPLHNLKPPPSYATPSMAARGNNNHPPPRQQHQQQPLSRQHQYHPPSARSTPNVVMRRQQPQPPQPYPNNNNNHNFANNNNNNNNHNTPHHRTVTPHPSSTTTVNDTPLNHNHQYHHHHHPNTADLEAVKRRRLL